MPRSRRWPLVVLFVGIALLCARLGLWQVDRLQQRRAANAAIEAARLAEPVDLTSTTRATDIAAGQAVSATGTYDFDNQIVVMGRVLEGTPGVHVLTPLRLAGSDRAVLVNRGFVPAADAFTVDLASLRADDSAKVEGVAQEFATTADRSPPSRRSGALAVSRVHYGTLRDALPYRLLHVIIQQSGSEGAPALPRRLPPAVLDDGPHMGYAVQWFAFAAIALVFAAIFWRGVSSSRRAP